MVVLQYVQLFLILWHRPLTFDRHANRVQDNLEASPGHNQAELMNTVHKLYRAASLLIVTFALSYSYLLYHFIKLMDDLNMMMDALNTTMAALMTMMAALKMLALVSTFLTIPTYLYMTSLLPQ